MEGTTIAHLFLVILGLVLILGGLLLGLLLTALAVLAIWRALVVLLRVGNHRRSRPPLRHRRPAGRRDRVKWCL